MSSPPIGISTSMPRCSIDAQGVVGEVERAVARPSAAGEERRHLARPHPAGVGARGVQERAAGAVDRAHRRPGRAAGTTRATDAGSSGFVVEQRRPSRGGCPTTSWPSSATRLTTALMHGLRPGTSPPPVRMPIRIARGHTKSARGRRDAEGGARTHTPLRATDFESAASASSATSAGHGDGSWRCRACRPRVACRAGWRPGGQPAGGGSGAVAAGRLNGGAPADNVGRIFSRLPPRTWSARRVPGVAPHEGGGA